MKRTLAIAVGFLAGGVNAGTSVINSGASMTTGPSLNHYSVFGASANPAMAPLMIPEEESWRITFFPSIAANFEIGDVENFADDVDDLIDLLDDASSTDESATETLDRFNDVLGRIGEEGYIKNSISIHAPITPLYYQSEELNGTFGMDLSINTQIAALILDDVLSLDSTNDTFSTNTSLYMKSGIETRVSFTYGGNYFDDTALSSLGKFYAGAKLNVIRLELSKQVKLLEDFNGEDIEDVISDDYDKYLNSSTNVGLDVGVMWDADWYRLGLTLENLNSPSFEYGELGVDCESITDDNVARNTCEVSRYFISEGRIDAKETHTMHAKMRVDSLLKVSDRWFVSSSIDLAKYDDIVGFENQWLHLATTYETEGWWLPSTRIGYQKNLAGSELSSVMLGFTFFKSFNFDLEYGLESVEVDGSSGPRRLGFSLAFTEKF
ncbi:hypothetical protein TDB9533_02101 [Thalassocella blandensis]|nr:hypothetical protein TDB9533_02101 [Thalassocella blandensis]